MRYYRVASQVYVLTKDKPRNFRRLYDVRNTQVGSEMDMKLRDKDGLGRRRMHRVTQEIGYRGDVWEYLTWTMCEDLAALEHGSVMHRDLAYDLIRSYSRSGDLVLDFCAGTGTTGVAALMTGRQYLLFEPWDEAVAHAQRRLANMIRKL